MSIHRDCNKILKELHVLRNLFIELVDMVLQMTDISVNDDL
jgi:hypothetical protein